MRAHSAEQLLADLKWLLQEEEYFVCDHLLSSYLVEDWRSRLTRLENTPDLLVHYMSQATSHFLGAYFERLFSFAVRHFADVTVLAEHQQIHVAGRTFGEVDVLLKDAEGRVVQCEIAVKFYLQREDLAPNQWIGPNKHDSLFKKVTHARTHQLQVLSVEEGQRWLRLVSDKSEVVQNLMIFGRHFYDLNDLDGDGVRALNGTAGWLRCHQLGRLAQCLDDLREAQKPYWLTAQQTDGLGRSIDGDFQDTLMARFRHDARPVLFSCEIERQGHKAEGFWLFVCPDDW